MNTESRPRVQPHLRIVSAQADRVILVSETSVRELTGKVVGRLLPLCDGERTVMQLADELREFASRPELMATLLQLTHDDVLTESGDAVTPERAFWYELGIAPQTAEARVAAGRVEVVCMGTSRPSVFADALTRIGLHIGSGHGLRVVLTSDYLDADLAAVNEEALRTGRPWLLAKPSGVSPWIGPLFEPSTTACWLCLAERLRANLILRGATSAALPSTHRSALDLTAIEVAKYFARGETSELSGTLLTLELGAMTLQKHRVTRNPRCSACGGAASVAEPAAPLLRSRPKRFTSDGGHRIMPPEETLAGIEHLTSPITGVIGAPRKSDHAAQEVAQVFTSRMYGASPLAASGDALSRADRYSGGKGKYAAQAKISAMCEALERTSGRFRGDEFRIAATYRNLAPAAIHPRDLLLFSDTQYAGRTEWNARNSLFQRVDEPFDVGWEIEWSPVWSLVTRARRWIPTAYAYYGYEAPDAKRFCVADSNGCAAGNCLEEAILQGFFELVERDGVAMWWYSRARRPAVDLDGLGDPFVDVLLSHFRRNLHREVWVLDVTTDLGIPTFVGVSRRFDSGDEQILLGAGAHLDARMAVVRALTEMIQLLPLQDRMPDEWNDESGVLAETRRWLDTARVTENAYLLPKERAASIDVRAYPRVASDDIRHDVEHCVAVAQANGLDVLVLDQTRKELGLSVVRVIVPGLRHFWARFAPGRLYDVPVRLGWIPRKLEESELNPLPMFL